MPDKSGADQGFTFTAIALAVLFVATTVTQLPEQVIGSRLAGQREAYRALWPQSWAFFSHADDKEFVVVYRGDDARRLVRITQPTASAKHLWGLDRGAYGELLETIVISQSVPADRWRVCDADEIAGCADVVAAAPRFPIALPLRTPSLCGDIVLAIERPQPWHSTQKVPESGRRLQRLAAVTVTC